MISGRDEVLKFLDRPAAKQFACAGMPLLSAGEQGHGQRAVVSTETAISLYRSADRDDQSYVVAGCGDGKFIQRFRQDRRDLFRLGLDIAPGALAGLPSPVTVARTPRSFHWR
ncbi:hypothetical protein [Streptomyces fragilis]|uniref:Uncharacterized protein n=1 Tax=Streptomyces fragilis TaxID=67301 RepID=A0ABV2YM81_9ACTN|nr:hypothetical protein [Streptomyces fragilis]